jgi:MoxR-like ATPase
MAAPYWKSDRVNNLTPDNVNRSIGFLKAFDGSQYSDLTQNAITYFQKPADSPYFGQIVTHMNILGLFVRNNDGTYNITKLADDISNRPELAGPFLEYFLTKFQYPRPHLPEHSQFPISKPYFIILKILIELYRRNPTEAYLTQKEFYYLFDNNVNSIQAVNDALVDSIINNNRNWGRTLANVDRLTSIISYDKALFNNSSILTISAQDYPAAQEFFIGLKPNSSSFKFASFLYEHYRNQICNYDGALDQTVNKNNWAQYIHSQNDFKQYLNYKNMLQNIAAFTAYCNGKGFYFTDELIRRFLASLSSKPFLLLTGISGTGKSKIAELFGEFLVSINAGESLVKAVESNWNDQRVILGYLNPLLGANGTYFDTPIVQFVKKANADPAKLFILLLDEMNLSYTERYFSDFLSALESRSREITLPDKTIIKWSDNLKVIGTINEDETTHTLSPKVIDRSNIIEMNGKGPAEYLQSLIDRTDAKVANLVSKAWHGEYITLFNRIYEASGNRFGYRVMDEITQYVILNVELTANPFNLYLDEQVYQKILPKIHGTRGEIKDILHQLQTLFNEIGFANSKNKTDKMVAQLSATGFTSFVTA